MVDCLTEEQECFVFVQWCRLNNIRLAHIANESRSGSKSAMIRGAKLKRMGQSKGYWDYQVFVPQNEDKTKMIIIEMKREKGGSVSPEQKEWGEVYKSAGIPCKICKGAYEAIDFVKSFLV